MTKIIIGTTPTITYKFNVVSVSDIVSAILTIKERGTTIIEKSLADAARCSTTYFSTANAAKVDAENSTIKIRGYLYRYKSGGVLRNLYSLQNHLWANPIE